MTNDTSSSADGRDGLAHLQDAAREMISATRSLLDAMEGLVDDPATLGKVVDVVSTVARTAAGAATAASRDRDPADSPGNEDDDRGSGATDDGVERIEVR